jgi:catechol 2,3-dioxygenase-like lactoylglutathione lyase family enzyme
MSEPAPSSIAIRTLHHVTIVVTDLAAATAFYGGVLGLVELPRPPFGFGGAWYALGDRQLHLLVNPTGRTLRGTGEVDSRDGHFAVRVASYDETLAHLRSHGLSLRENRLNATPWAQIFAADPDGNLIEFNAER